MTLKISQYLLKGVERLMGADPDAASPAGAADRLGALCQEKNLTMLKKSFRTRKAIEDPKQGRINDLVRQKAAAITGFDEKLVLGSKPEGAPASRKKTSAFATGMKIA